MKQWNKLFAIALLGCMLCGCARADETFVSAADMQSEETSELQASDANAAESLAGNAGQNDGSTNGQEMGMSGANAENAGTYYVHVSGAVYKPGVYPLSSGSRVYEAINLAGGLREDAYEGAVNQAELITDGQMIVIPTYDEYEAGGKQGAPAPAAVDDGLININTADENKLCELPGIGLSRAQAIIAYREEHGNFTEIAQIQNVTGIKAGLYSKIEDKIKISN